VKPFDFAQGRPRAKYLDCWHHVEGTKYRNNGGASILRPEKIGTTKDKSPTLPINKTLGETQG